MDYPPNIKTFVNQQRWTFAKTYAETRPHEYLVRDHVDEEPFVLLVKHIRKYGYEGTCFHKPITYFDEDGMVYWTMDTPVEETTIVNRCSKEQTYEYRLKHGTLPESKGTNAEPGRPRQRTRSPLRNPRGARQGIWRRETRTDDLEHIERPVAPSWKITNDPALQQSRHRGGKVDQPRHATNAELTDARSIAYWL